MGELGTNDLWGSGTCDSPSQYARMIPGISAIPARRFAPKTAAFAKGVVAINEKVPASVQPRTLMQLLLPHPIADPFTLYQLVVADLIVLAAVCGLQKLLLPAWSLPQLDLPLFAVLVTLFGFSEGVYRNSLNPFPAGSVPGLARSVLFATTLVFVAESDAMVVRAIPTTFASSLAGLLLWRQLRQFAWARRSHDTESRRVLMVGGGPVARSIARALGHDPLERTVVQGFIDDNLPLSPTVLG